MSPKTFTILLVKVFHFCCSKKVAIANRNDIPKPETKQTAISLGYSSWLANDTSATQIAEKVPIIDTNTTNGNRLIK